MNGVPVHPETLTPASANTVATEMTFKKHLCKGCARDRRQGQRLKTSLVSSENFTELLHSEASVSSHLPHRQQEPSSREWWRKSSHATHTDTQTLLHKFIFSFYSHHKPPPPSFCTQQRTFLSHNVLGKSMQNINFLEHIY